MYKLFNELFEVKIKEKGAELSSFFSKRKNTEYMWQGNPDIWSGQAPILFPVIGCLKDDGYLFKGKEYKMPKHGFVRHSEKFEVVDQSNQTISFRLKSDEELKRMYPFEFEFLLTYEIKGSRLEVKHEIKNIGNRDMYFSLGGHPAFVCPRNDGEEYEDYYLEFTDEETDHTYEIMADGLIGGNTKPVLANTKTLPLHKELFIDDALVFKNLKSRKCSLKSRKSSAVLSVEYPGFPYLGIWAKPGGHFVCIEPWIGIADSFDSNRDFTQKDGIIKLEASKEFTASYFITVEE